MFRHYEKITLADLTGFLLGSLNKVWPWKETVEFSTDRHGEIVPLIQENIMPQINLQFVYSLSLIIIGLAIIFIIEFIALKLKRKAS